MINNPHNIYQQLHNLDLFSSLCKFSVRFVILRSPVHLPFILMWERVSCLSLSTHLYLAISPFFLQPHFCFPVSSYMQTNDKQAVLSVSLSCPPPKKNSAPSPTSLKLFTLDSYVSFADHTNNIFYIKY